MCERPRPVLQLWCSSKLVFYGTFDAAWQQACIDASVCGQSGRSPTRGLRTQAFWLSSMLPATATHLILKRGDKLELDRGSWRATAAAAATITTAAGPATIRAQQGQHSRGPGRWLEALLEAVL